LKVEQWAERVPKNRGEERRRQLLAEGILDTRLKPVIGHDMLWFPVTSEGNERERVLFEAHEDRGNPVARHELVGGIAIMQEHDPDAAKSLLASRPGIHTVLSGIGDVQGEFRTREFEVLAGEPTTKTTILEYGHRFVVDLSKAYFSSRLATERQRVARQVTPGEVILDMFAGVGPFAITVAEHARLVVAADINPDAILLLEENRVQNRCRNVLPVLADSHRLPGIMPWKYDRVIMNLPMIAHRFLREAWELCREGGTIHLYVLESQEGELRQEIGQFPVSSVTEHEVRSYSPGKWHAVYDIVK